MEIVMREPVRERPEDSFGALLRGFDLAWLPRDCGLAVDRDGRSGVVRISVGADARLAAMIDVYRRERAELVRFARSLLGRDHGSAEDLLQEVMRKVCQNPPTVREPGGESAYLHGAIRKQALTVAERAGRERTRHEDAPDAAVHLADPTAPFEDPVLFHLVVARALAGLSPRQRDVVELVDVRGMTVSQAAGELDIALGTVKNYRFLALRRLKDDPELGALRDTG